MLLPCHRLLLLQVLKATNDIDQSQVQDITSNQIHVLNFVHCVADFALSGSSVVTFPATILSNTMQQACISVAIIDDTVVEASEEFTLQLITDDPQARLTTDSAVVSILDNDSEH